jgi:hypothetical protein
MTEPKKVDRVEGFIGSSRESLEQGVSRHTSDYPGGGSSSAGFLKG